MLEPKTTYEERFGDAIYLLVGGKFPPKDLLEDWIEGVEWSKKESLQDWVGSHMGGVIWWAQAIAVLDAAHVLASQPEEGEGHECM
jgi:hypothetical protein